MHVPSKKPSLKVKLPAIMPDMNLLHIKPGTVFHGKGEIQPIRLIHQDFMIDRFPGYDFFKAVIAPGQIGSWIMTAALRGFFGRSPGAPISIT
jgi:hypothetical protein